MSDEDFKFLENAMNDYTFSEYKEMLKIIEKLSLPEEDTEEDREQRVDLIEELISLAAGPENANSEYLNRFSARRQDGRRAATVLFG